MAVHKDIVRRKPRLARSRHRLTQEYIEECKALQERILSRRGGEMLPSSVEDIRQMRDGRLR